jgi:hypothetical protein
MSAGPPDDADPTDGPQRERGDDGIVEQAERLAEEWSSRAAGWIARTGARAREEAEDIWAEAQAKHRGE